MCGYFLAKILTKPLDKSDIQMQYLAQTMKSVILAITNGIGGTL